MLLPRPSMIQKRFLLFSSLLFSCLYCFRRELKSKSKISTVQLKRSKRKAKQWIWRLSWIFILKLSTALWQRWNNEKRGRRHFYVCFPILFNDPTGCGLVPADLAAFVLFFQAGWAA